MRKKPYRTFQKTHAEGKVQEVPTTRFSQVNCCGEGPLSATRLEGVNRRDTPKQVLTGGPVTLNKGESIFQQYPRRVGEGETIRSEDDER
jgi:hypothetical protein